MRIVMSQPRELFRELNVIMYINLFKHSAWLIVGTQ